MAVSSAGSTARTAIEKAGLTAPVGALWMGLAGAGRAKTQEAVEIALRSQELAVRIMVGMDVEGAHQDAFQEGPGVILSVGTGTMLWGRDPEGGKLRVGGWGQDLGEEGSGYWIGLQGLRAVVQASDGRGDSTALSEGVLDELGLSDPQDLVPWMAGATKRDVASLAPLVLRIAEEADAAAQTIRDRALDALTQHLAVAKRGWEPWGGAFPLAVCGGLLDDGGLLRPPLLARAGELGAEVWTAPVLAVRGAAHLALTLLD
jgi:N-acetylglucosamine kinase-like BadF-type ATPase